jgi:hypothetical protein
MTKLLGMGVLRAGQKWLQRSIRIVLPPKMKVTMRVKPLSKTGKYRRKVESWDEYGLIR